MRSNNGITVRCRIGIDSHQQGSGASPLFGEGFRKFRKHLRPEICRLCQVLLGEAFLAFTLLSILFSKFLICLSELLRGDSTLQGVCELNGFFLNLRGLVRYDGFRVLEVHILGEDISGQADENRSDGRSDPPKDRRCLPLSLLLTPDQFVELQTQQPRDQF